MTASRDRSQGTSLTRVPFARRAFPSAALGKVLRATVLRATILGVSVVGVSVGIAGAGAASAQSTDVVVGSIGSMGTLSAGSPVTELPAPNPATGPWVTTNFLTPESPAFWNPALATNRLVSPFGLTTPVQCTSFHGVLLECFQKDREGFQHKLVRLASNLPNVTGSLQPGGGPGTFVYADPAGWSAAS